MRRLVLVVGAGALVGGCSEDLQVRPGLHPGVRPVIERHLEDHPENTAAAAKAAFGLASDAPVIPGR